MNSILPNVAIFGGLSLFRENFGYWIRPTRESTVADDRIKHLQRVMTLFQILAVISASYVRPPNANICSRNWTGWSFSIASFSGISAQLIMEIMLAVSAQMLVMYDTERSRANTAGETIKHHRDEYDKLRNEFNISQDALIRERFKKSEIIEKLQKEKANIVQEYEKKQGYDKYLINMLYERIESLTDREKGRKELLLDLREKIEENTKGFAEGDYIVMMNLLKELYK